MKILYFAKTSEVGPSSRYRIFQYLPHLRSCAMDVAVKPLFGPTYFRLLKWQAVWLRTLAKFVYVSARFIKRGADLLLIGLIGPVDLIVIEGQLFPYMGPAAEWILTKRYKVVVELDDAIYLTYRHGRKIPALLQMSSGAIVGNRTLAEYASTYTPNVWVIPTVVDTERFYLPERRDRGLRSGGGKDLIIVWIGLAYNASFLDPLLPALHRIQKEYRVSVRIISSRPYPMPGVKTEFRPWAFETEVPDLQSSDIGVMPLPDTEWARGKCGLKLLQYMAVGIPCVASPVGANRDIIADGWNGFLAATNDEWYARLSTLCGDPGLRSRMGRAGRNTVESQYSLKAWAPRLADSYRALIDTSHTAEPSPSMADPAALRGPSLSRRRR